MENDVNGGVVIQALDFVQPIEVAAVRAAAVTVIVVAVDVQAWRVIVIVKYAADFAIDRPLADQLLQRDARKPLL
jgi:hypothetical protein